MAVPRWCCGFVTLSRMDLTPQSLHSVEFREARRGGYNTRDVDDFIERVAAGVATSTRGCATPRRAEAAEERIADLQREIDEARRRPAAPEASETDETLRRTLVLAQRTADATIKEAKEEANRVLSEAREEAARTRAEAEAEARRGADSARVDAQAEVETLLANRDRLKSDLGALTRRIDDQPTSSAPASTRCSACSTIRRPSSRCRRSRWPTSTRPPAAPGRRAAGRAQRQRQRAARRPGRAPRRDHAAGAPAPRRWTSARRPSRCRSPCRATPAAAGCRPSCGRPPTSPWGRPGPAGPRCRPGAAVAPDPGSRPSEWGRAVFEPEPSRRRALPLRPPPRSPPAPPRAPPLGPPRLEGVPSAGGRGMGSTCGTHASSARSAQASGIRTRWRSWRSFRAAPARRARTGSVAARQFRMWNRMASCQW